MMRPLIAVGIVYFNACLPLKSEIDRMLYKTDEEIDQFYRNDASDRGAKAQHESLNRIRKIVRNLDQDSSVKLIPELGEALRKLSRYNIFQVRERINVYDLVQSTLLSIPGHARYFADEIKREQKEVVKYPTSTGPRISYDRNRSRYFITLTHLPSPETIAVLGEFLSDEIDTPRQKLSPHSDWGENPRANSFASTNALSLIGLREPPASKALYDTDPDAHLARSRAWWEKIKSGETTFSFKGQAVEYRFKPDGTWDTIPIANPPDDGPKPVAAGASERPLKRPSPSLQASQDSPHGVQWWWYAAGGTALFALGISFFRKKSTA